MCEHPGVKSWPCAASASNSACPAGPTLTTRDRAECGYIEKSGYRRLLLTLEKLLEGPRLRGGMRHAPCKSSLWPILHVGEGRSRPLVQQRKREPSPLPQHRCPCTTTQVFMQHGQRYIPPVAVNGPCLLPTATRCMFFRSPRRRYTL